MTAPLDRLSEKLSEIRAYVEAPIAGPWRTVAAGSGNWAHVEAENPPGFNVASGYTDVAEFIARARTDLPLLLAVAEAAQEVIEDQFNGQGSKERLVVALAALSEQA